MLVYIVKDCFKQKKKQYYQPKELIVRKIFLKYCETKNRRNLILTKKLKI